MRARIYYAHAICTYDTFVEDQERAVIRKVFPTHDIVDPGTYDNEEKMLGGMDYCMKLVKSCNTLVFSRVLGKVTAGVGKEIEYALSLGIQVYELVSDGVRQVFAPLSYLSREETRELYTEWENEFLQ